VQPGEVAAVLLEEDHDEQVVCVPYVERGIVRAWGRRWTTRGRSTHMKGPGDARSAQEVTETPGWGKSEW